MEFFYCYLEAKRDELDKEENEEEEEKLENATTLDYIIQSG